MDFYSLEKVIIALSNAITNVEELIGRMWAQDDTFFWDAHVLQLLPHIDIGSVLLESDFAVLDIEVEDDVINAAQALPTDTHESFTHWMIVHSLRFTYSDD